MKLSAIAAIMRKSGRIDLYKSDSDQLISDGYSIYKINALPDIKTEDQIISIIGVPSNKQGKFTVKIHFDETEMPTVLKTPNEEYDDEEIAMLPWFITYCGEKFAILCTENEVFMLKEMYLKPLAEYDDLYYYIRYDKAKKNPVVVAEAGFLGNIAAICPTYVNTYLVKDIMKIAERLPKE